MTAENHALAHGNPKKLLQGSKNSEEFFREDLYFHTKTASPKRAMLIWQAILFCVRHSRSKTRIGFVMRDIEIAMRPFLYFD